MKSPFLATEVNRQTKSRSGNWFIRNGRKRQINSAGHRRGHQMSRPP
jgi:hypothetical protein